MSTTKIKIKKLENISRKLSVIQNLQQMNLSNNGRIDDLEIDESFFQVNPLL